MTRDPILKIIGVSLALSFLYLIRIYRQLLYPAYDWYFEYEVPRSEILYVLLCSIVLSSSFLGLLLLIRVQADGRCKDVLQLTFIAIGVLAFGPLSVELLVFWFSNSEVWFKYVLPVFVLLVCLLLSARPAGRLSRMTNNLETAAILILPISILTFGHALLVGTGMAANDLEPNSVETTTKTPKSNNRLHRLVWVVFDELDFNFLTNRPSTTKLPAFEELISSSFVAENAFSPHFWTSVSFPALLTGRKIYWVNPHGPAQVTLHLLGDESAVELAQTETIFDDVSLLDGKAAVAGWYHPYPRLFGDRLAAGYWTPGSWHRCRTFGECASSALAHSFEDVPGVADVFSENPFLSSSLIPYVRNRFLNAPREHAEYNLILRERAEKLVTDADLDVIFLHFPTPHAPYLTRNNEDSDSYFEALESADETLSILRDAMKNADLWDRTTLIVSSDHWMRSNLDTPLNEKEVFALDDTRIPFILRPAGGGAPYRYTRRFNTVITRYLVKSIITGEVSTAEHVSGWLDRNANERSNLVNFHPCRDGENPVSLENHNPSKALLTCR